MKIRRNYYRYDDELGVEDVHIALQINGMQVVDYYLFTRPGMLMMHWVGLYARPLYHRYFTIYGTPGELDSLLAKRIGWDHDQRKSIVRMGCHSPCLDGYPLILAEIIAREMDRS